MEQILVRFSFFLQTLTTIRELFFGPRDSYAFFRIAENDFPTHRRIKGCGRKFAKGTTRCGYAMFFGSNGMVSGGFATGRCLPPRKVPLVTTLAPFTV